MYPNDNLATLADFLKIGNVLFPFHTAFTLRDLSSILDLLAFLLSFPLMDAIIVSGYATLSPGLKDLLPCTFFSKGSPF